MKPPGYNAESARAAEVEEEERQRRAKQQQQREGREGEGDGGDAGGQASGQGGGEAATTTAGRGDGGGDKDEGEDGGQDGKDGDKEKKRKAKTVDVFGRKVVTGEDFEILKNAPRWVRWQALGFFSTPFRVRLGGEADEREGRIRGRIGGMGGEKGDDGRMLKCMPRRLRGVRSARAATCMRRCLHVVTGESTPLGEWLCE